MSAELRDRLDRALPPVPPLTDDRLDDLVDRGHRARRRRSVAAAAAVAVVAVSLAAAVPSVLAGRGPALPVIGEVPTPAAVQGPFRVVDEAPAGWVALAGTGEVATVAEDTPRWQGSLPVRLDVGPVATTAVAVTAQRDVVWWGEEGHGALRDGEIGPLFREEPGLSLAEGMASSPALDEVLAVHASRRTGVWSIAVDGTGLYVDQLGNGASGTSRIGEVTRDGVDIELGLAGTTELLLRAGDAGFHLLAGDDRQAVAIELGLVGLTANLSIPDSTPVPTVLRDTSEGPRRALRSWAVDGDTLRLSVGGHATPHDVLVPGLGRLARDGTSLVWSATEVDGRSAALVVAGRPGSDRALPVLVVVDDDGTTAAAVVDLDGAGESRPVVGEDGTVFVATSTERGFEVRAALDSSLAAVGGDSTPDRVARPSRADVPATARSSMVTVSAGEAATFTLPAAGGGLRGGSPVSPLDGSGRLVVHDATRMFTGDRLHTPGALSLVDDHRILPTTAVFDGAGNLWALGHGGVFADAGLWVRRDAGNPLDGGRFERVADLDGVDTTPPARLAVVADELLLVRADQLPGGTIELVTLVRGDHVLDDDERQESRTVVDADLADAPARVGLGGQDLSHDGIGLAAGRVRLAWGWPGGTPAVIDLSGDGAGADGSRPVVLGGATDLQAGVVAQLLELEDGAHRVHVVLAADVEGRVVLAALDRVEAEDVVVDSSGGVWVTSAQGRTVRQVLDARWQPVGPVSARTADCRDVSGSVLCPPRG